MKYIGQLTIILGVSFVGEILNFIIPLPVPASIYGLIIMFILLCAKVIKVKDVQETSGFFLLAMPILFIVPGVGLIDYLDVIKPVLVPTLIIMFITTIVIMVSTGRITQFLIKIIEKRRGKNAR